MSKINGKEITEKYQVRFENKKYGDVYIKYVESAEAYMIHCDFKKSGKTNLIINTPDGKIIKYKLIINNDTYKLEKQ